MERTTIHGDRICPVCKGLCGTYQIDTVPAPSDVELETLDRRADLHPTTRMGFNYFVKLRNVNHCRPYFHAYVEEECGHGPHTFTLARWDTLLALYDHHRQEVDMLDYQDTVDDARYAGT